MILQEYVDDQREALDEINELIALRQKIGYKYDQLSKMELTTQRKAHIEVLEWLLGKTPASWSD